MKSIEFLKENGVDIEASLNIFGDINTYNASLGEFIVGVSEKVNKLNALRVSKDMKNFAIYAHSLKSDAKYFGFNKLSDLALKMEENSKNVDYYYINEHFNELVDETNKAIKIVREYMKDPEEIKEEEKKEEDSLVYEVQTILVVDDSNIIRNFVKKIFEEDYEVGCAKDGEEAINIIKANKDNGTIKAMLLDLNMPKVDGFVVLDYLQENKLFDKIPTSIITGDSSKETIDKAFKYGIIDMLGKPFNNKDVKSVVEKTLMVTNMK